jgi:hypothetical protein
VNGMLAGSGGVDSHPEDDCPAGLEGPPTGTAGLLLPWSLGRRPWGLFPIPSKMIALGNRLLRRFCWVIIKLSSTSSATCQGLEWG